MCNEAYSFVSIVCNTSIVDSDIFHGFNVCELEFKMNFVLEYLT